MGVIMGTAAYMSPEQARGKPVDKRADIWAFGTVLFEMLTGQRPFTGRDVSETLAAVMMKEPEWPMLPTTLPAPLGRLLRRCLEREPKDRLRDIGDARVELRDADQASPVAGGAPVVSVVRPAGWRQALPLALGISAVAVVITGIAVWTLTRAVPSTPRPFLGLPFCFRQGLQWAAMPFTTPLPSHQAAPISCTRGVTSSTSGPWIRLRRHRFPERRVPSGRSSPPMDNGSGFGLTASSRRSQSRVVRR